MSRKHLLSVAQLGQKNLVRLIQRSLDFAQERGSRRKPLEGKIVGSYFPQPSTRTRTSFTVGTLGLGPKPSLMAAPTFSLLPVRASKTLRMYCRAILTGWLSALTEALQRWWSGLARTGSL